MRMWLTAAEIAELALPGLPTTKRNVNAQAEREGWAEYKGLARPRDGRGGGLEYHVNLLPVAARVAYYSIEGGEALATAAASALSAAPELPQATGAAGEALDARIAILAALKTFRRAADLGQAVAVAYFADFWRLGRVDIAPWVRDAVPSLAPRTLMRWLAMQESGQLERLAVDRGAARRGSGVLDAGADGAIKPFVLALVAQNPLYTAVQLHDTVRDRFGARIEVRGELVPLPGLRTFERALKRWKEAHATELLAITNPDKFRSTRRVSGSYVHLIQALNEQWQIDASPVDALCVDGRHSIYICVDIWSRRLCLLVSRTPRSEAVQLLLRKAILAWGVPDQVKTDNGSDFVARATKRLLAALQIDMQLSAPFSPWQKGPVERAVRTFQTDCGRMLPGFIGHSVADRKVIESRRAFAARLGTDDARAFAVELTGAELQSIVDRWAEDMYAQRPHRGLQGETPFGRAARWAAPVRRVDEEALAVLLMQAPDAEGRRVVGKQGIRIDGYHYMAPGLTVGDRVFVRLDPADKGKVWCFDEDGEQFLAVAICPELAGVDPAALRAEVAAKQRKLIEERSVEIKAARRQITSRTVLDARLRLGAENAGNLVAFPRRSDAHSTPALEQAADVAALRKGGAPISAPLDDDAKRIMAEIEAATAAPAAPPKVRRLRAQETPQQRHRRYRDLKARIAAGEDVPTADAVWVGGYALSAECRSMDKMFENFGEAGVV